MIALTRSVLFMVFCAAIYVLRCKPQPLDWKTDTTELKGESVTGIRLEGRH